jgi:isopropylmalate/homocitrate/citramalate synthase
MWERVPRQVEIVEVGPRDGLQNEAVAVDTADKVRFIDALARAGLRQIEATSFVHPHAVPQMADAAEVMAGLERYPGVCYWALVPNLKGLERALRADVQAIAVFTGATDSFTQHNIGMTIQESLATFEPVVRQALAAGLRVRGYISVAFGCPYEGRVAPGAVLDVARQLLQIGCETLSLGDTIGVATPNMVPEVAGPVLEEAGVARVGLHFHDTNGTALANVLAALLLGVATFDSSAGGLGGCPYALGAPGNVATENLLYMLHGMGIETGVDQEAVAAASMLLRGALSGS